MKNLKILSLMCLITLLVTPSHGSSIVQTPTGLLSSNLPIPININIEYPNKDFEIEIISNNERIIRVEKKGSIDINLVSTRFQASSDNIITIITYSEEEPRKYVNNLNLTSTAVIPDNSNLRVSTLAGTKFDFTSNGTEYRLRTSEDTFRLLILNAVSRSNFVNLAEVQLTGRSTSGKITINGSPYWFEPLISVRGNFTEAKIINIQSGESKSELADDKSQMSPSEQFQIKQYNINERQSASNKIIKESLIFKCSINPLFNNMHIVIHNDMVTHEFMFNNPAHLLESNKWYKFKRNGNSIIWKLRDNVYELNISTGELFLQGLYNVQRKQCIKTKR